MFRFTNYAVARLLFGRVLSVGLTLISEEGRLMLHCYVLFGERVRAGRLFVNASWLALSCGD